MPEPKSNKPLIKDGNVSTSSSSWQKLLELHNDPNMKIHIQDISISLSTYLPTSETSTRLSINGTLYLRDFSPVVATTTLSFGGDLIFEGKSEKPPILVQVKSDGSTTLYATCTITGIESS